jgi:hypothetical protein
MMDHVQFDITVDDVVLFFYGRRLVNLKYIESMRVPQFGVDWYFDNEGIVTNIEVIEDDVPFVAQNSEQLFAQIVINGQTRAVLEIWDGPNGRVYHLVSIAA